MAAWVGFPLHWPCAEERRPKAKKFPSADEWFANSPPVGVFPEDIVDKLGEDDRRLLNSLEIGVTNVGLQKKPLNGRDGLIPRVDE